MRIENDFVISEAVEIGSISDASPETSLYQNTFESNAPPRVWSGATRLMIWISGSVLSWSAILAGASALFAA